METALNESRRGSEDDPSAPHGSGPDAYRPDDDEPFMNARQLAYFRTKLTDWKDAILRESAETLTTLQNESLREPDVTDRASSETDWSLELRTRDRQRKLVAKIEAAIKRIDEGEYGYCEVTGDPISLGRLEARPIATMTVEAQERHERNEKISRDE
jgi:DnaK suppressor protein